MRFSSIFLALVTAASQCLATSCDFDGGFSVRRSDGCGDDTVSCKAGASSRCCPQGSWCFYTAPDRGGNAYCCPENSDCLKDILNYPQVGICSFSLLENVSVIRHQGPDLPYLPCNLVRVWQSNYLGWRGSRGEAIILL